MARSPSYSPPRRGGSPRRGRSPQERGPRKSEQTSLLVRNIPRDLRSEELRVSFEHYGQVKDVYLPRDFHTQEPRGFGFIQFVDEEDAKAAQHALDRTMMGGREITVVFAEENRKRPQDMRERERVFRARVVGSSGGYRRSPPPYGHRSRSYSRSPPRRRYSPSPPPRRTGRYRSPSPPPRIRNPYHDDYPPRRPISPQYDDELPPHRGYPTREPPMRGPPRGRSPPPYDGPPPRGRSPQMYDGPMRGRSPPPYGGPPRGRSPLYD